MDVLRVKNRVYSRNLNPGKQVYGESLADWEGAEYREWDPYRSKMCAAMLKGIGMPIRKDSHVLYLGAAQGTTVSHLSDAVPDGIIYCVEVAAKPFERLIALCEDRENLIPIMEDAMHPERYADIVGGVDFVYQDISQRNQAEIFVKNVRRFLKPGRYGMIAIKARSISIAGEANDIFDSEMDIIKAGGLKIKETVDLSPFDKDHIAVLVES